MAGTVNKVILIGRLGADPDVRYMPDGSPIANFNIATDEPIRSAEGSWEEKPEWHRIVAKAKLAEIAGNYLSKGKLVYIEGRLKTRQWEDAQGVKRYTTEVVAREIKFLGSGGDQSISQAQNTQANLRTESAQQRSDRPLTEELPPLSDAPADDIPF